MPIDLDADRLAFVDGHSRRNGKPEPAQGGFQIADVRLLIYLQIQSLNKSAISLQQSENLFLVVFDDLRVDDVAV